MMTNQYVTEERFSEIETLWLAAQLQTEAQEHIRQSLKSLPQANQLTVTITNLAGLLHSLPPKDETPFGHWFLWWVQHDLRGLVDEIHYWDNEAAKTGIISGIDLAHSDDLAFFNDNFAVLRAELN